MSKVVAKANVKSIQPAKPVENKKKHHKQNKQTGVFLKTHDASNNDAIVVTKFEKSQGLLPPKWVHPVDRTVFEKTDEEKGHLLTLKKQWKDEKKCSLKNYKFKTVAKMVM